MADKVTRLHDHSLDASDFIALKNIETAQRKTGGALPQAPPLGHMSSPHATTTPTGEAGAVRDYAQRRQGCNPF